MAREESGRLQITVAPEAPTSDEDTQRESWRRPQAVQWGSRRQVEEKGLQISAEAN